MTVNTFIMLLFHNKTFQFQINAVLLNLLIIINSEKKNVLRILQNY